MHGSAGTVDDGFHKLKALGDLRGGKAQLYNRSIEGPDVLHLEVGEPHPGVCPDPAFRVDEREEVLHRLVSVAIDLRRDGSPSIGFVSLPCPSLLGVEEAACNFEDAA